MHFYHPGTKKSHSSLRPYPQAPSDPNGFFSKPPWWIEGGDHRRRDKRSCCCQAAGPLPPGGLRGLRLDRWRMEALLVSIDEAPDAPVWFWVLRLPLAGEGQFDVPDVCRDLGVFEWVCGAIQVVELHPVQHQGGGGAVHRWTGEGRFGWDVGDEWSSLGGSAGLGGGRENGRLGCCSGDHLPWFSITWKRFSEWAPIDPKMSF